MKATYIQWCNENCGRAYPISEHATRQDVSGQQLPDDIIADMCITAPVEHEDAFISSVQVSPMLYSVCIAASTGPLLTCTVSRRTYTPFTPVPMEPVVPNVSGWIIFGNRSPQVVERYRFTTPEACRIEGRAVRVMPAIPVTAFRRIGGNPADGLQGVVQLVGASSVAIRPSADDPNTITLTLAPDVAPRLLGPCTAYPGECMIPPVCSIAGVTADEDGILTIRFTGK